MCDSCGHDAGHKYIVVLDGEEICEVGSEEQAKEIVESHAKTACLIKKYRKVNEADLCPVVPIH